MIKDSIICYIYVGLVFYAIFWTFSGLDRLAQKANKNNKVMYNKCIKKYEKYICDKVIHD